MSNYTPGPWQSDSKKLVIRRGQGSKMSFAREAREDCYLVETADGGHRHVAFVRTRIDANAIAAVPEMLALLDEVAMELSIISPILRPANGHVEALIERIYALLCRIDGE